MVLRCRAAVIHSTAYAGSGAAVPPGLLDGRLSAAHNTPVSSPSSRDAPASAGADRSIILLLACAAFVSGAALRVGDPLIPRLAQDFSVTAGVAGRIVVGFSIAYGLMQLVFGPLGDRYGKPRLICAALIGGAVASLASAVATDFDVLVVSRIVWGMSAAGIIPLGMAFIGDRVAYGERQAMLARFLTGTLSGMMAGQLLGGLFGDSVWGWRGAFLTMTIAYVMMSALMLVQLRGLDHAGTAAAPGTAAPAQNYFRRFATVLREPWAWRVLSAVAAEGIFLLGPLAYLPAYLHHRFDLSLSLAAALIALYAIGGLVYALTARRLVGVLGERRMVLWGGILMGAGFVAALLSPWWALAGPIALVVGFGTYLFHATLQTHATQMVPAMRGTAVAVFAFCLFGGQALGVLLAGETIDRFGFAPVLLAAAIALPLAGLGFAAALKRRERAPA